MISHVRGAWIVARKEMMEHVVSKRFFIISGLFALSLVIATTLGPPVYDLFLQGDESADSVPTLLYFYLTTFQGLTLISLLAVILSADAMVSEWKDRTLFLLLSKPISRASVLFGKVLAAYLTVLVVAVIGFFIGLTVLIATVSFPTGEGWLRVGAGLGLIALGILPFIGLGVMFSSLFKSTATSYAISIVLIFLVFPVLFTIMTFVVILSQGGQAAAQSEFLMYFQLISPSNLLSAAASAMIGEQLATFGAPSTPDFGVYAVSTVVAIGIHSTIYLGVSYWVVSRRDYG